MQIHRYCFYQNLTYYRLATLKAKVANVSCRVHAGRTKDKKVRLPIRIRSYLGALLSDIYSLSVDIVDMDPDAYKKRLLEDGGAL